MSAQVKLRAWIANKPVGEEFTTTDVRTFLKQHGFAEEQSGTLMMYMVRWWQLVERVRFGHYRRV